jgi:UDP-2,4-diacetamido-2,4,6-trideoxy-beta-L-altropyranose hydrolase
VVFVWRNLGEDLEPLLRSGCWRGVALPAPSGGVCPSPVPHAAWAGVDAIQDAGETSMALRAEVVDWIIVDHYSFDATWHRHVADQTGARLAVVDDLADRRLECDVLVDHNVACDHRQKYGSLLPASAAILGGPGYALLGPSYAAAPRYRFREQVDSIGIFMGGADAGEYSAVAWRACRQHAKFHGYIEIVTTASNPQLARLNVLRNEDPKLNILTDLPELSAFFARHDLQIGAGGGATWERCCVGAPSICILAASNQRAVLGPLQELGVLCIADAEVAAIGRVVYELIADPQRRSVLAFRGRSVVDGLGAERVARFLMTA